VRGAAQWRDSNHAEQTVAAGNALLDCASQYIGLKICSTLHRESFGRHAGFDGWDASRVTATWDSPDTKN